MLKLKSFVNCLFKDVGLLLFRGVLVCTDLELSLVKWS